MTTEQVRRSFEAFFLDRTAPLEKDITRRNGWAHLMCGDQLCAVEKSQGLGKGGKIVRICIIEVVSVRVEPLRRMLDEPAYGLVECRREGFPWMVPEDFVSFFCKGHKGITRISPVTRIEFKYVKPRKELI